MTTTVCSEFRNINMTSSTNITTPLESSQNRHGHQVPLDVKKATSPYSTSQPSSVLQASSWSPLEETLFASTNSSLSTHLTSETRPKLSIQQQGRCTPKAKTISSKTRRKRKRRPKVKLVVVDNAEDVPDYDDECSNDEEKDSKAIQLQILKSLNAKHKEEEKRKQGKSKIKNPFDDIPEKEIEKLATKIYGGDTYTREVSEGDLKNMKDVYMDIIKRNKGKKDRQSIIETMVLQNNIMLIDTEMKRRDNLNKTGK